MKKIFSLIMIFLLSLALVSCKDKDKGSIEKDLEKMTSLEYARAMGNGTNLGNTMEAYGKSAHGFDAPIEWYETYWGQPITTKEIMRGIKDSGFDSIRIPVAWTNMMDLNSEDLTINPKLLNRVAEIVDYALELDMFVVVNDHWDGGWWGMFGSPEEETREKAWKIYEAIWTQVGNHFKDYSYRLMLESANEELGHRLNDEIRGVKGVLTEEEAYVETNLINQKFVDVIRSTGSKNAKRFLLIAGFNTDIDKTVDDRFQMPTDTVENKLLLSVHYYTPSSYAIFESVLKWGNEKEYDIQNRLFEKMTKYTDLGYGIVIGEYGALRLEDGTHKPNAVEYMRNILNNTTIYGYVPMLWDTSNFFDRKAMEMTDDDIAELMLSRSNAARKDQTVEQLIAAARTEMALDIETSIQKAKDEGTWIDPFKAYAWIMYVNTDWDISYILGDEYMPYSSTEGVVATDVIIEEVGTYTISLNFEGTSAGHAKDIQFMAIGLYNGEDYYPNHVIVVKSIVVDGENIPLQRIGYTTSDDGSTTRVNIVNDWVSNSDLASLIARGKARTELDVQLNAASPTIINKELLNEMKEITITFELKAKK